MVCIELRQVTFQYERGKRIFENISIKIEKDETTALLGPNGSGKTTLGKLMVGVLRPSKGQVYIFNKDSSKMAISEIGSKIGYLFQNPEKQFFTNSVYEELSFVLRTKKYHEDYIKEKVDKILNTFQLQGLERQAPFLLSQGEKKRLALAAILINKPDYLILDEPTLGLDGRRKEILLDTLSKLKKQGIGMTIISHDDNFVKAIGDRLIGLSRGEIVYDQRT
ncbi:MAG: ABC transporter ATP-binding protein [Tissierellia bacterium]|nr:ABC transporter ATP-binding protein [Tissierellia bacterium]